MRFRRILHLSPALFGADGGIYGGGERYVLELARHMAEVVPTRLVSFGTRDKQTTVGRLQVRVYGPAWHVRGQPFNPLHAGLIREVLQADVIHCHQRTILASSLSALLARLSGRRVFVTDLGCGGWDLSAYVNTERWFHGHLHISEYSRRIAGHDGKPWARVILGGVDTDRFCPDPRVPRAGNVLFVGRLLGHKGVDDLIRAMPGDMPLEVIGKPYHDAFLRLLHELAKGKQVCFRHNCDDAALVEAYRKALCVVLPSVYRDCYGHESTVPELLGQTLIEGMACGIPAICTDVASMPEVVEHGVTGFVVPPNNSAALRERLLWLRDHPKESQAMGEAARQRVLICFTWDAVVRRCLEAYHACAS